MKKLLSLTLSICMLLIISVGFQISAYAETVTGNCGTNVTWSYDKETCELTISGTGTMKNYTSSGFAAQAVPWRSYRSSISKVVITGGVTSIGNYAFASCTALASVKISDTVTSIGNYVFKDCSALTSISIPSSVTSMGTYVFNNCSSLTSVTLPNSLESINNYMFSYCSALKSIKIPSSVKLISSFAFTNCTSLTSVTIPSGVEEIKVAAFAYCTSLTSITIPGSVYSIGTGPFRGCDSLANINVSTANENYCSVNGVLFDKSKSTLIQYPIGNSRSEYKIPDTVTALTDYAFYTCTKLKDIAMESTLTSIGNYAFYNTALSNIYYIGLKSQWSAITIGNNNEAMSSVPVHYCSFSYKTPANCTIPEKSYYTCVDCKTQYIENISPALGHKSAVDKAVASTCTKTGWTQGSHCSVCGITLTEQKVVAKKQHTYTTTKATTKKNGSIKCKNCGAVKSTIYYPKKVKLSKKSFTYDGKAKKPGVTVKDSKGNKISASNYKVTYSKGRKKVGKYTVKITFKGNYSGSVTKTFTIKPKGTKIKSVTSPDSGSIKVKWKKQSGISGYEFQISTSKKFPSSDATNTLSFAPKKTTVIGKVTRNKKYYVRVRTFKNVKIDGKSTKIYSSWSEVKSIKIKK